MRVVEGDANRPFPYADPRSLSQAWYDALYGSRARPRAAPGPGGGAAREACAERRDERTPSECHTESDAFKSGFLFRAAPLPARSGSVPPAARPTVQRERPRNAAAPAPANRPAATAARTTVNIAGADGNGLTLLLEQRGARLKAIAVSEARSAERAGEALARARIALAAKGIRLEHDTRIRGEA